MFLSVSLLDEFNGEGIFKLLPLVGSDGGQNGENNIHNGQTYLQQTCNAGRPKKSTKLKIVTADVDIQVVQVAQSVKTENIPVEKVRHKTDKERNGNQTGHNGIQQHADLKVQCLFAVVIDKVVLLFVGHPKDQGHNKVSEGDKVLRERRCVDDRR